MSAPVEAAPATSAAGRRRRSWQLLGRLIRAHRRTLWLAVLGGVGWQLAGLVVPLVIGWTVDRGIDGGDRSAVWWGGLMLVLLGAVEAAGAALRHRMACSAYTDASADLRLALTDAALGLDDDGRARFPAGEVIARETSDADTVAGLLDSVGHTVAELLSIPIIVVALALIDPVLALLVGALVPIAVLITWKYSVVWDRRAARAQEAMGHTVDRAQEIVEAGKPLRGIGAEAAAVERFAERSAELRRHSIAVGDLWLIFEPMLEALSVLSVAVVLWIGGDRVISGDVELGGVVTAIGFVLFLSGPVRTAGMRVLTLQSALASADRVVELLDASAPSSSAAPGADPAAGRDAVELRTRDLVVGRRGGGQHPLLRGDLVLPAGSCVLVTGPTGSGKSTLLAVLAGLRPPLAGVVELDGRALPAWPSDVVRRRVLLCGASPFLFAGSVGDNLRFADSSATDEALAGALADAACDFVGAIDGGLDAVIGERGVTLSGGQRQRLAIARALVARPSVLLLDGATSAVDSDTELAVLAGVRRRLPDCAIVLVSANAAVAALATGVVRIDGDRVVT